MVAKKKDDSAPDETLQLNVKGISASLVQKIQVIAGLENVPYNEVYQKAFETYVALYEQKNGRIKIKPKGDGLDVL